MARVLVIDDDAGMLAMMRRILVGAGHVVEATDRSTSVLSRVAGFQPDLVLTDIFMPEVDGFEVIRLIRRADHRIPIIVISGNHLEILSRLGRPDWPYYLRAARCLGADCAIAKPFTPAELLAAIDHGMTPRPDSRGPDTRGSDTRVWPFAPMT